MTVPAGFVVPPDPAAPAPAPAAVPAPAGDTAQDRINQLVKQSTEQDTQLQATQAQNTALVQKINELTTKVDSLQTSPGASADDPIAQLLSESTPAGSKGKTLTPQETAKLIAASVQQAIAPLVNRAQAADEQAVLAAAQNQSFVRAAQAHPKANDPNSALGKAFAQIWDGLPDLQSMETGPELAVAIARGVLVDTRAADATVEQQKVAATVTRPNLAGPTMTALKETNDAAKAAELSQKLVEKGSVHGLTHDEELQMLQLKLAGG